MPLSRSFVIVVLVLVGTSLVVPAAQAGAIGYAVGYGTCVAQRAVQQPTATVLGRGRECNVYLAEAQSSLWACVLRLSPASCV